MKKSVKKKKEQKAKLKAFAFRTWMLVVRTIIFLLVVALVLVTFVTSLWLLSLFNWNDFDFQILLGYVQTLVWPFTVIVILFVLKNEIAGLIARIKSASAGDKRIDFDTPVSQQLGSESAVLEASSIEQPRESPEDARTRIYQMPEVQLAFERIYRKIFGTQLQVLNVLASAPEGVPSDVLSGFYDRHIELLNGAPNYILSLHDYMSYLVLNGLVNYVEASDSYVIDHLFGPLFLTYLAEQGLSDPNLRRL